MLLEQRVLAMLHHRGVFIGVLFMLLEQRVLAMLHHRGVFL